MRKTLLGILLSFGLVTIGYTQNVTHQDQNVINPKHGKKEAVVNEQTSSKTNIDAKASKVKGKVNQSASIKSNTEVNPQTNVNTENSVSGRNETRINSKDREHVNTNVRTNEQEHVNTQSRVNEKVRTKYSFRTEFRERHPRAWFSSKRVILFSGGYWFYDDGCWYPAIGYADDSTYITYYPICGVGEVEPGSVATNVQIKLHERGYYNGPADGVFRVEFRDAIAHYQGDNELFVNGSITDELLISLGLR